MAFQSDKNNNKIKTFFDYSTLSSHKQIIIKECTGEIKERLRRTARDIWEVGKRLTEVRSQLERGQFEGWLSAEFGWSRRTAYNFINVYEAFSDSANFTQLDIATSALYKLAAPSTPQSVRQEFLSKAEEGEKITHKQISQALKTAKESQDIDPPQPISPPAPQTPEVIEQPKVELDAELEKTFKPVRTQAQVEIKPNCWYLFDRINFLFSGDTALAEFINRVPEATLVLAITTDDWDHDWLMEKANNVIVIKESSLRQGLIEQTIALYTEIGDTVIFPWLPDAEMLAIAHRLKRRIIAGDSNLKNCQNAISQLGLYLEEITLTLV